MPEQYWYNKQRKAAEVIIARWERRYAKNPGLVGFLVRDALLDTRSPGRRSAFEEWRAKASKEQLEWSRTLGTD